VNVAEVFPVWEPWALPMALVRKSVDDKSPLMILNGPGSTMPGAFNKAVGGAVLALVYIGLSASMILFNKALMHEHRFPFPVFLTTLHMVGALGMSLFMYQFAPALFPSAPQVFSEPPELDDTENIGLHYRIMAALKPFCSIAGCGAMSLVTSNWAYRVAPVSFLQMVKESHIIIVYALMVLFGLDRLRFKNTMTLVFVAICSMVAVSAQVSLSISGLVLQTICGIFGSLQLVLTNLMMSRSGKGKIDPMTMVLCTAPVMLAFLLPANIIFWDPRIMEQLHLLWRYIACNMALAFTLQVTIAVTVRSLSATGFSLASILKDLGIVFAASCVLGENLSTLQICGFLGSIFGIGLYSLMKLFPEAFEFPSSAQGSGRK